MEFLSIPVTSAASERAWSRAAQVLSPKKARLSEKVASNILFVKENLEVFCIHHTMLIQKQGGDLPLEASGIPEPVHPYLTLMLARTSLVEFSIS